MASSAKVSSSSSGSPSLSSSSSSSCGTAGVETPVLGVDPCEELACPASFFVFLNLTICAGQQPRSSPVQQSGPAGPDGHCLVLVAVALLSTNSWFTAYCCIVRASWAPAGGEPLKKKATVCPKARRDCV